MDGQRGEAFTQYSIRTRLGSATAAATLAGAPVSFGDATFSGSMGGLRLNAPMVGIDTAFTEASSGVLINVPAGNPNAVPSRTSYTYTFPDRGVFSYICAFHQMMTGTVVVG